MKIDRVGFDLATDPYGIRGQLGGGLQVGNGVLQTSGSLSGTYGIGVNVNHKCKSEESGMETTAKLLAESKPGLKEPWLKLDAEVKLCTSFDRGVSEITSDPTVEFFLARASTDRPVASVAGHGEGWFDGQHLDVSGNTKLQLPLLPDLTAEWNWSEVGIGACGKVGRWLDVGVGFKWRTSDLEVFEHGCDVGRYQSAARSSARGRAAQSQAFNTTVPAGLAFASFAVQGTTAPPLVTVRGPGSRTIDAPATLARADIGREVVAIPVEQTRTTYVFVRRPSAGRWTVAPRAGSSSLAGMRWARNLPEPKVSARVVGRGKKRTLRWELRPIPGQKIRFFERRPGAARLLLSTNQRRGKKHFRPLALRATRRTIVAQVTEHGLPRKSFRVARFTARQLPRLRAPRRLEARLRFDRVRARWRRVGGAQRYLVEARTGRRVLARRIVKGTAAVLDPVPKQGAFAVSVRALASEGRVSPASRKRVKRRRPH
jgi:hypothetical protein